MEGQKTLKNSSVLVIGAGGLGSPCLLYLAAAGVGHVGIVDADTVDASNLQRQIIHGTGTVGVSKCESARQRMRDVNPHVQVRMYQEEFTSASALRILRGGFEDGRPYDAVVDGSDNFPTKYLINDACDIVGVPWVYSAILAFEGQLSVFNYKNGPTYRDLLPTPPPPGEVPSCAEGGVLGVLPGTMGCLQATEVIKLLLGKDGICTGRVLTFDALKMRFGEIGLAKRADSKVITELIDYQGFCAGPKTTKKTSTMTAELDSITTTTEQPKTNNTATAEIHQPILLKAKAATRNGRSTLHFATKTKNGRTMDEAESTNESSVDAFHSIDPKKCLEKLKKGWAPWVLDVRLQTEHDIVSLPFTDKVSPHRSVQVGHVPKSGDILVYCKAGVRGKKACNRLIELGVDARRLYNLDGGIMKWQTDIDPSMPRY
jgi:adenylyltransferase/sulfurtransferase